MRTLLALLAVAGAFAGATVLAAPPSAPGQPAEDAPPVVRGHLDAATPGGEGAPSERSAVAAAELKDEVTITVRSSPGASVRWGGRQLGTTPLVLKRPRESGPLDLTLTAAGCLPLHVRAYTFSDDTINARLVRNSEKQSVFGYPASLDAGVPPEAPAPESPPTEP